jgi:diaminohydroxyphosphoribosylaminopyrimidine deaminase/5-amino-6-(5-phosphoribosylamino)uracil reductase
MIEEDLLDVGEQTITAAEQAITAAEQAITAAEQAALDRALTLAATGPFTRRGGNPRVGCVLLDAEGETIAEGHHRGAGTPHAEVVALAAAGQLSRDATAVVTLEPCAHQGRTGPCADALLRAGIRRLIFAQPDPNPMAAGGAERLRAAGVEVIAGVRAAEAIKINSDWTFAHQHGRPRVRLKIATTLDGRVAAADGTSQWITSAAARADGHRLRAGTDAILVGTGTVLADNPRLTARRPDSADGTTEDPVRFVLGTRRIPAEAAILHQPGETVLLPTRSATEALSELRERGISSVLIEGGPRTAAAFLSAGLVDEVIAYVAPAILGAGRAAVDDLGLHTIGRAIRGRITDIAGIGDGSDRCVRIVTALNENPPEQHHDHEGAH